MPSLADVRDWTNRIGDLGYTAVRTNALTAGVGRQMESAGYVVLQDLVLLEHTTPRNIRSHEASAAAPRTTHSLDSNQLTAASAVDLAAFGTQWGLSATAIADACKATPRYRLRGIGEPLAGYAVSGRDGSQGFLQRLSVAPDHQRRGLGRALVVDSLVWMARWRVQRVLVNTALDNDAALSLYQGLGFRRVGDHLRVYERALP
ncbi:MAG: GNAT family N-acetyltransferase [Actinobacteria bacterium]|nr:GNAT family N-acetyltransferase [Actinomycetota bacterium]